MLVQAVVCPATPMLVPEVAAGAAGDLAPTREASLAAVRDLLGGVDALAVLVPGPPASWPPAALSLARLGLPGQAPDDRPLALHVARWLLEEAGWREGVLPTSWWSVDGAPPPLDHAERLGVLVLGDGSARRSERAPGYAHPEAQAYDERAFAALGAADLVALQQLDPEDDERLLVAGRPAWVALAALAAERGAADGQSPAGGRGWSARLLHADAPLGVGYAVAAWRRAA